MAAVIASVSINSTGISEPNPEGQYNDIEVQTSMPAELEHFQHQPAPRTAFFALIIGINIYQDGNIKALRGAEADAKLFQEYLINSLKVPDTQVEVILGSNAVKNNIEKAFTKLETDELIKHGDAIVIYYAGHGGERAPPDGWETGGQKIQMILPYDFSKSIADQTGISDYVIGRWIEKIARAKGKNITVIFDCCHAASGTRDADSDTLVRSVSIEDFEYSNARGIKLYDPHHPLGAQDTHVFLAACGSSELALEHRGRGKFSTAFLKLLQRVSPENLSYSDILTQMDTISGQNPHCEGKNLNRILFDGNLRASTSPIFRVRPDTESASKVILKAGSVHGITSGAEFAILTEGRAGEPRKGEILKVSSVRAFESDLDCPPNFKLSGSETKVLQTKIGDKEDCRIYAPDSPFRRLFDQALKNPDLQSKYSLNNTIIVDTDHDAHLAAKSDPSGTLIEYKILGDREVKQYGCPPRYSEPADVGSVAAILDGAAHFYRSLRRFPGPEVPLKDRVAGKIDVGFFKLEYDQSGDADTELELLSPGDNPVNLCQNNRVDFVPEADVPYGLMLTNNSKRNLYVNVFYFHDRKLEISSVYQNPLAASNPKADVDLKGKGGKLPIGYGAGGGKPLTFHFEENEVICVDFLKIYVSTTAVDLAFIERKSPFEVERSMEFWKPPPRPRPNDIWDSILIPITQRCKQK